MLARQCHHRRSEASPLIQKISTGGPCSLVRDHTSKVILFLSIKTDYLVIRVTWQQGLKSKIIMEKMFLGFHISDVKKKLT